MQKTFIGLLACASCLLAAPREDSERRLNEASAVLSEVMGAPDKGIPHDLLEKAQCAVVVPGVKKGALIVGAQFGKGFITCREQGELGPHRLRSAWKAEASVSPHLVNRKPIVVMLVMNRRGADRLMQDHFTLGGEGEIAAGPVYR